MRKPVIIAMSLLAIFIAQNCSSSQPKQNKKITKTTRTVTTEEDFFFADAKNNKNQPKTEIEPVADLDENSGAEIAMVESGTDTAEATEPANKMTGYASWYGKELQGRPTASGELFDMHKYTAAHRDLPMGSIVLVRNVENGEKQLVRINDRGPYVDGRIIDVSYAAAKDMGFAEKGVAKVELEVIKEGENDFLSKLVPGEESSKPVVEEKKEDDMAEKPESEFEEPFLEDAIAVIDNTDTEDIASDFTDEELDKALVKEDLSEYHFADNQRPVGFTTQAGVFSVRANAERLRKKLQDDYHVKTFIATKDGLHYVWVGDFTDKGEARAFLKRLKEDGQDIFFRGKVSS